MLVSEKQMKEGEGLFIHPVVAGLGYQAAGAFQRLGRRMEAFVSSDLEQKKILKLPLKVHHSVEEACSRAGIFAPHPALSFNSPPPSRFFDECVEMVLKLRSKDKDFHDIWVLPRNTLAEELDRIRKFSPRSTLLLSPAAYGFRDEGLFDETLQISNEKPGLLGRVPNNDLWQKPFPIISFAELAGHLVTIPQNEKFFGKNVAVEGSPLNLKQWLESFREIFNIEIDFLEKLASKMSFENPLGNSVVEKLLAATEDLSTQGDWLLSSEAFPAPLVPLQRSLKQLFDAHQRHPDLELVFTPSRAPG